MSWEISSIKLFRGESAMKGEASVRVSWGFINGFKIMKKADKIWVNVPQIPFKDKDGNTKYKSIIKFNDEGKGAEILKQVSEDIIKAYKEEVKKQRDDSGSDDEKPKKTQDDDDDYKPKKRSYDDDDEKPKKKQDDDDYKPKKKSYDSGIDIDDEF